jgi:hypothetical protein
MPIDYEAEVKKVYPDAIIKHWSYDNGSGVSSFWVVCSSDDFSYNPLSAISKHCKTRKQPWQSAYKNIKQKQL